MVKFGFFISFADCLCVKKEKENFDHWIRTRRREEVAKVISGIHSRVSEEEITDEFISSLKLPALVYTKEVSEMIRLSKGESDRTVISPKVNINNSMTNKLRSLVSKKKLRYQKDGFDLDLSYITDRIIAMGFPSEGSEGLFRNPLPEVYRLLETKHKDHYKVYNLCSERTYNTNIFHRRVGLFPFDDHNCPEFKLIIDFCLDVDEWLKADSSNVVAIHCKAGKGRTGLMISSYFLYSKVYHNPKDALEFFGKQRTSNGKGVTIPSQKRYVEYFSRFLSEYRDNISGFYFAGNPYVLTNVRMTTVPKCSKDKGCDPYFVIRDIRSRKVYDSRKFSKTKHYKDEPYIDIPCSACVRGDIKFIFYNEEEYSNDTPICHFWVNTNFMEDNYIKLTKIQIDKATKDSENKKFSEKFGVELYFRPDDIVTAEEMKQRSIMTKEQVLEEAFSNLKEAELELKELTSKREQMEEDIEQLIDDNKSLQKENDAYKSAVEGFNG